jgi:V/A-type H+-transporting ATPase subunit D
MIQHTRTNLLLLKEKSRSVEDSMGILKARRQALIQEFLNTAMPFIRSRDEIRNIYGKAIEELSLSLGYEGKDNIESITFAAKRDMSVEITERSIWGLRYRDVVTHETAVRMPDERGYDYFSTTPHLEECINGFERILESMLELAAFESKLKRLGDEILKTTRKIRVLEERVLPDLKNKIKAISQYLGERERESYYRLKVFKNRNLGSFKI